jgi:hypothetical protein
MAGPVPQPFTRSKATSRRDCHAVKIKGGFEQLPDYIKGTGEPCCTPDLFRLLAERRALAAAESSSISKNPFISDSCAYRLCHPNVVPMETAEPND